MVPCQSQYRCYQPDHWPFASAHQDTAYTVRFDSDAGVGGTYTIHGNFFAPSQSDNASEIIRDAWGNEVDVWGTCNVDP
jgi:hypothetical protein